MKEGDSFAEERANREIAGGLRPLIFQHWAARASFLNPQLGQKRYSLNQALKIALELVGFGMDLLHSQSFSPGKDGGGSPTPGAAGEKPVPHKKF